MEKTEFEIDENDFEPDVLNDVGLMCVELFGEIPMYLGKEGTKHKFSVPKDVVIDIDAFKRIHRRTKAKRMEVVETTDVRVVKYRGNYYILDGDKKIALFD